MGKDPVTGKEVPSTVDRYYVPGARELAVISLSPDAEKKLVAWHWPGNVRELANVVSRLVVFPGNDAVHDHEVARAMF